MIQYLEGQTEFTYDDLKAYAQLLESQLLNGVELEKAFVPTFMRENYIYTPEMRHIYIGEIPQLCRVEKSPIYIHAYDDIIEKGFIDIKVVLKCRGKYDEIVNHVLYESRINKSDVYRNLLHGKIKVYEVTSTTYLDDCEQETHYIMTRNKADAMYTFEELKIATSKNKHLQYESCIEEENLIVDSYKDYNGLGIQFTFSCTHI